MLLTEQEITNLAYCEANKGFSFVDIARAIESAVIARLKAQEPVAYLNKLKADPILWKNLDFKSYADENWLSTPLYEHPDPRVAELEAVLRECRDELRRVNQIMLREAGIGVVNLNAIAKIDEVLNEDR